MEGSFDVTDTLQSFAEQFRYTRSASRKLQIDPPKAYYKASAPAVEGREGLIVLRCEFSTLYDVTAASDVVTVTNGEAGAAMTTPRVNI